MRDRPERDADIACERARISAGRTRRDESNRAGRFADQIEALDLDGALLGRRNILAAAREPIERHPGALDCRVHGRNLLDRTGELRGDLRELLG